MRQTFFGSALVCLAACGGKPQTCTVALSGAQTGTYDCSPAVLAWASSVDTFNFGLQAPSSFGLEFPRSGDPQLSVGLKFRGEPQPTTYTDATVGAEGSVSVEGSAGSWRTYTGNQLGSITLKFTRISNPLAVGVGKGYGFVGTLDATLPSRTNTATTVTLHATFNGVP